MKLCVEWEDNKAKNYEGKEVFGIQSKQSWLHN